MFEYKGYTGVAGIDAAAGIIFGRVIGVRDVITFQGETVAAARQAFHDSVDDYLAFCAERGERPERPYSGRLLLRVPPDLHRALAISAALQGTSLNGLIERILTRAVREGAGAIEVGSLVEPPRAGGSAGRGGPGRSRAKRSSHRVEADEPLPSR